MKPRELNDWHPTTVRLKGDVGIYAGPGNIHWQLDRVGLSAMYQNAPTPGAPPATAPDTQLASLPNPAAQSSATANQSAPMQPAALTAPASQAAPASNSLASNALAANTLAEAPGTGNQEVIVIVRDRNNPTGTSQVMTLRQPTADLMRLIKQQAR